MGLSTFFVFPGSAANSCGCECLNLCACVSASVSACECTNECVHLNDEVCSKFSVRQCATVRVCGGVCMCAFVRLSVSSFVSLCVCVCVCGYAIMLFRLFEFFPLALSNLLCVVYICLRLL